MANPTTNFGWQMPTSTDLVTDLPADFEVFGQAVDTALVDLKGGTTGQVLSKASNTNMDFTWVTTDDANAIQNSIVDAKGDIVAASANDTPARLAVGNNGETLVADSSTSTGLRYTAGTVQANPILNSAMQVWQRGTSVAISASNLGYTADRWMGITVTNGAVTVSRQATGDTTNLPSIQYGLRFQRNSGQTGTGNQGIFYSQETVNSIPFAGKTVTLSFYARRGANFSPTSNILQASLQTGTGTDENIVSANGFAGYTGVATPLNADVTLTTTWQRFTVTGTLSSSMTELGLKFFINTTGTAGANDWFEVTGVQVDVGSVALPFRTYAATIQGELAACRRYLPAFDGANFMEYFGYAYGTNTSVYGIPFDVPARVAPTGVTITGSLSAFALNTPTTVTPTFNSAGLYTASLLASHTITAGQGSRLQVLNGAKILFTGCEL